MHLRPTHIHPQPYTDDKVNYRRFSPTVCQHALPRPSLKVTHGILLSSMNTIRNRLLHAAYMAVTFPSLRGLFLKGHSNERRISIVITLPNATSPALPGHVAPGRTAAEG